MKITLTSICITLLLAATTLSPEKAAAQTVGGATTGPISVGGEDCRIRYSYDAAGNRVKREYKCVTTLPYGETGIEQQASVYPNPTSGVFHVSFSEAVEEASFMISASDGRLVLTYELMQPAAMVSFDITHEVPGTYFLTIWAMGIEETHSIIKSQ